MKITTPLNFTHIVGSLSLPRIANNQTTFSKSDTSILASTLPSRSTNINYLKSFDTAVIAYHMMGLSNFE